MILATNNFRPDVSSIRFFCARLKSLEQAGLLITGDVGL